MKSEKRPFVSLRADFMNWNARISSCSIEREEMAMRGDMPGLKTMRECEEVYARAGAESHMSPECVANSGFLDSFRSFHFQDAHIPTAIPAAQSMKYARVRFVRVLVSDSVDT